MATGARGAARGERVRGGGREGEGEAGTGSRRGRPGGTCHNDKPGL